MADFNATRSFGQRGMSLVELMVAIAIGMFMVAALVSLFARSSFDRRTLDLTGRQIENGRYALDSLRDEIVMAGYYGEVSPKEMLTFASADPCTGTLANMGWDAATSKVPLPIEGGTTLPVSWNCGTLNRKAGTEYLVIRYALPASTTPAGSTSSVVSIQAKGCQDGTTAFAVANGGTATNFPLTQQDCSTAMPVRELRTRLYFVATCGVCSPNDGIPTLKVLERRAGTLSESVVADGVENLSVEYGLDTTGDGVVDSYTTTPTTAQLKDLVAMRVRVIARTTEQIAGYVDGKTIGGEGGLVDFTPATADQAYKRKAFVELVALPNIAGPRELP
jgi:type IV pilus assembly protein PilW